MCFTKLTPQRRDSRFVFVTVGRKLGVGWICLSSNQQDPTAAVPVSKERDGRSDSEGAHDQGWALSVDNFFTYLFLAKVLSVVFILFSIFKKSFVDVIIREYT